MIFALFVLSIQGSLRPSGSKIPIQAFKNGEDEEGIHVDFDLKFPWEKNEEEEGFFGKLKPFIPKPFVPKPFIPKPVLKNAEDEEGIHVDFDLKFPWEKNEEEEGFLSKFKPFIPRPVIPKPFPKPVFKNAEDEEGIHVDFDLKFPWEKNEDEEFICIIPRPPKPVLKNAEEEEGIHVDFDLKFPWE